MKKYLRAIALIIVFVSLLTIKAFAKEEDDEYTVSEVYIPSGTAEIDLTPMYRALSATTDYQELEQLIQECQERKDKAHEMAEATRALGYENEHPIILFAKQEYANAEIQLQYYQTRLEEYDLFWKECYEEYPAATEIWLFMKDQDWNDYVCAGILGNIMSEVGGGTLDIQYWLYGSSYYGICQWSKGYKNQIWGADLETQCQFLIDTIKYEIDTFGYAYKKGFDFEAFLELEDEEEVAKAFAVAYERCSRLRIPKRQKNAAKAYDYFVS